MDVDGKSKLIRISNKGILYEHILLILGSGVLTIVIVFSIDRNPDNYTWDSFATVTILALGTLYLQNHLEPYERSTEYLVSEEILQIRFPKEHDEHREYSIHFKAITKMKLINTIINKRVILVHTENETQIETYIDGLFIKRDCKEWNELITAISNGISRDIKIERERKLFL